MKKTILTLAAILIASLSFAQGGGFNYKALITDNGNVLNTQPVTFKFTVLENGATSVYQETQNVTTDANGIVAVNVGEGTLVSGNFTTIDWGNNPYFLKVEIDTGSGYQDFGTTEFKAVPYAKFANRVAIADNIQGIPVSSNTPTNGQILKYNGSQFVPADDDTSGGSGTDGVVNSAAVSGTSTKTLTLGRSNGLGNVTANFTDNDTHLTDAQIGAMGYIKNANDADHDASNELQTLTLSNTQLSISNGNNVNFTGWDTDASDDVQSIDDLTDAKNDGSSVFIGNGAGSNDDGTNNRNVGVGFSALHSNSSGRYNTASGSYSLSSNTTGENNTASGNSSLSHNTTGSSNTANGSGSLRLNTTGSSNTASGQYSLYSNTIGYHNTAIGRSAGYYNETGNGNIFLGYNAGYNETGSNKLYIENSSSTTPLIGGDFSTDEVTINGSIAIKDGTQGANKVLTSDATGKASWVTPTVGVTELNDLSDARSDNDGTNNGSSIFIGVNAGANDDQSNNKNVGLGYHALYANTTGYWNTASGYGALSSNTTGNNNTANGKYTLSDNTTGYWNTASGSNALSSNTTGNSNTAAGFYTLYSNTTGHSNTASGDSSLFSNTTGHNNTAIGYSAGYHNETGSNNIFLGYNAGYNETGSNKLYIENSDSATPLIGGDFSTDEVTINGSIAIKDGTQGANKVLTSDATGKASWVTPTVGATQLDELSDAKNDGSSIFIGDGAGSNDDGTNNYNVGVGKYALHNNTTGDFNTANGAASLYSNTTGSANTASGYNALDSNTTGNSNTASGAQALYYNTTGYSNTASGTSSLSSNTTGIKNTAIGRSAGYHNETGSNNIFLGYNAGYNETGSNKLYIENSSSATPLIGGDFSTDEVTINGDLEITQKVTAPNSGDADMKAYIYGNINDAGGIRSAGSSDGFSISKTATGIYEMTFANTGNTYAYTAIASIAYGNGLGFIRTYNVSATKLIIYTYDKNGNSADKSFTFVMYKK